MNYELAKELKDAGFPKEIVWICRNPDETHPYCRTERDDCVNEVTSAPTLEELIEACGDDISDIDNTGDGWRANPQNALLEEVGAHWAKTPTEAVARLYIAINKKI